MTRIKYHEGWTRSMPQDGVILSADRKRTIFVCPLRLSAFGRRLCGAVLSFALLSPLQTSSNRRLLQVQLANSKQALIDAAARLYQMRCGTRFRLTPSACPVGQSSSRRSPSNAAKGATKAACQKTHHARSTARRLVGTRMRFLSQRFAHRMSCAFRCTAARVLGTTRDEGPTASATSIPAFSI